MKITTKCRYGIRAMVEISRNYSVRPTTRREIASSQELDNSYLENILLDLKNNGIVRSIRGVKGGFVLNRPPESITLLEIVESLQGEIVPSACVMLPSVCDRASYCVTRPVWVRLQQAQKEVLLDVTVRDLLDEELRTRRFEYQEPN
ncbi:MAG: Rrf2 family transcriptional regulator [Deltaproteobacteria bacterium]|nr:Rrf2 family transcriptional regulator [Deltaproteobacteria bacterium]MBT4640749.1 Rrf2 family transcriptional regulator [Deltaproteobacteria bacterium]MBT6500041.1 Rrf2 family transcriptional regulator [Deltaproteobacteria bacterium]MBT6610700.1 Rrf2 family transcriptional regulator [Deltaproteobacteria bacterium]MBT7154788.1 Rrf2 family transcriptional regulator [Deltaproteobacteria bacterium]